MIQYGEHKPKGYIPRHMDHLMNQRLKDFGAVEIQGTRWSGKSWTASAFASSITRVDASPDLYKDEPSLALLGETPHAIDEWQDAPLIWNHVKHAVDDLANNPGQFILTGSSVPKDDEARHSGAGRISRLRMRTMTLAELGISSKSVSLSGLFEGEFEPARSATSLAEYAEIISHGGWPALVGASLSRASQTVQEYLELLFDVSMVNMGKSSSLARRIAISLARNLGTSATLKTLCEDAAGGDKPPTEETLAAYLTDFSRNYFLDELQGWDAPVKAKSRVRTKPKRYLDDPSLAASLLSVSPSRLISDAQLLGILFESLCIHDLSVYAAMLPGSGADPLRYYSDADGLEVDAIIELTDGRWAAVEIKLGESKIEKAAKSLRRLKAKVSSNPQARNPEPEFMAIIVGAGEYARRRTEDGIYVVPLDTLTV